MLPGLLHRLPACLLGWRRRAMRLVAKRFLLSASASGGCTHDVGVVFVGRFQDGQKSLLGLIQVAVGHAVGHLLQFRIRGASGACAPHSAEDGGGPS